MFAKFWSSCICCAAAAFMSLVAWIPAFMASESACIVRFISSMWRISSSRLLELGESEDHDDHDEDRDDATMWLRGSGGPYLVKVYFQPWSARHASMFLPGLLLQARVSACNAASPRSRHRREPHRPLHAHIREMHERKGWVLDHYTSTR